MKKNVTLAPKKPEFSLIDEDLLKSRIYTIRGVKVMLDADLAEIYEYSTKRFNEQVKNNIAKFDEDFRFQLTKAEVENLSRSNFLTLEPQNSLNFANSGQKDNLRCKNCTSSDGDKLEPQKILRSKKSASSWGGVRYAPYAFTEQGIYMLMTVLKGEQATAQSKALIRLFKHAGEIRKYNISKKEWVLNRDTVMYGASYELKTALRAGISRKVLPEPANGRAQ